MKERDGNNRGFRVPEDYFESMESKMAARLKDGSRNGFKVPEGYFEDFKVKLPTDSVSSIEGRSKGVYKLNRSEAKKLIWMAAAATILLFFGVKYMSTSEKALDWEDLEQAEISSWIESDLTDLNAYDIAEAYPDVELDASLISNEELNAYLNEIELDQILYEN